MRQIAAEMSRKKLALNEAKWRHVKNEVRMKKIEEQLQEGKNEYWKEVDLTVKEGLDALTTVITGTIAIANIKINTTIKPTGICKKLFSLAKITIPNQIGMATAKMG